MLAIIGAILTLTFGIIVLMRLHNIDENLAEIAKSLNPQLANKDQDEQGETSEEL